MSDDVKEDDTELPPELAAWLSGLSPKKKRELRQTWELTGEASPVQPAGEEVKAARRRLEERLDAPARPRKEREPARRMRRRDIGAWAAALVAVAFGLYLFQRPVSIEAAAGEMRTAQLPDGSQVELNSGSRLTYRRSLGAWNRAVRLEGEAFFDVAAGDEAFTVETFNARVTVLGTRFNVRAWPEETEPATAVVLAEGAVSLAAEGAPGKAVHLAPGDMSRVVGDEAPSAPEAARTEQALAWRGGGIAFFDEPVANVAREIERRFAVQVDLFSDTLARERISLHLPRPESAEAVLQDLCAYLGCTVSAHAKGYEVRAD